MPAAKPAARKQTSNRPTTRADATIDRDSLVPEEHQDIKDSLEGRKFLEKRLLLCPIGEPSTHASLAACLYQIAALSGVPRTVLNAVRSVAFMLDEMEDTQINLTVKEAFDSQITEFTSDMKMLIVDAKEKLDDHFKVTEERLTQAINISAAQVKQTPTNTYASVLTTPPPHANPRIAAREGIRARQFLLEGISNTKFSHTDVFRLKTELNKILGDLGADKVKIRSVNKLRNGGALVEMESDEATVWLTNTDNRSKFNEKIGPNVNFCSRVHSLIAFNVPLAINPEDPKHRQEVCEANNIENDVMSAARWAKPINRRSPEQRTAHLILTFTSADAANRAITNGLYICNRRCYVERVRREPTRCLKCQGWNHFAKECQVETNKCGNCTKGHRTSDCPTPEERICVSCEVEGHASWSRECPTFIKKLNDLNDRNPENTLQYIPTSEPWTWTTSAKPAPQPHRSSHPPPARPPVTRDQCPPARKNPHQSQPRLYDTYIPRYDKSGKRLQDRDEDVPNGLTAYRPLNQQYIDKVNEDNPNRPASPAAPAATS